MASASVCEAGPDIRTPLADARTGTVLDGRYRLEELVGEGGMGRVYRACDEVLERTVAVKIFPSAAVDDADRGRRAAEARLLAALSHPSLVTLYDAQASRDGTGYLVMEYVGGGALSDRIQRGPLTTRLVSEIAADMGEALHAVHSAGAVHRDVKPSNVLLHPAETGAAGRGRRMRATLADFGIAYLADGARVTTPGMAVGTAAYFSPEQARGMDPSPSCDVYALGLVLIEALTGRRAFPQTTPIEAVVARLHSAPEVPTAFGEAWTTLLTDMTAPDPADRPSAQQVADRARLLAQAPSEPSPASAEGAANRVYREPSPAAPIAPSAPTTRVRSRRRPTLAQLVVQGVGAAVLGLSR
ncbi:serine/threonine-protein kinase [Microbacterium marinilacus]|uniref:non-specific serine/threonine protein kinase n=1 Tax=Microbacterium marinilacus TaxID=415209 RepID=A0ABP7B606_9MICO|nr:serine/threonine-protein kinase [Microbacterium marinilacus]MBY0690024.1 serine/threonine protein kinase [Microbacterium marinilacus]